MAHSPTHGEGTSHQEIQQRLAEAQEEIQRLQQQQQQQRQRQQQEPNNQADAVSVNTKVRLPEFFSENVEYWFWQVESAFTAASITADGRRYHAIIGQLPAHVIRKLSDFKNTPPPPGAMYDTLKERIIREFGDSQLTKITKLLEDMAIGDRKPSQLLADMRSRAANTDVGENLLQQLWMRNLPATIRAILSADDATPLTEKAATADRIMEAVSDDKHKRALNAVDSTQSKHTKTSKQGENAIEELKSIVADLANEVKRLRSRSQSRSSTPTRNRDDSSKRKYDRCWWHYKFGDKARKCKQPCSYKQKSEN